MTKDVDFLASLNHPFKFAFMVQVMDLILTTSEAARILGKHEQVVRQWGDKKGGLQVVKSMGGTRYYSVNEVLKVAKKLEGRLTFKNIKALLAG